MCAVIIDKEGYEKRVSEIIKEIADNVDMDAEEKTKLLVMYNTFALRLERKIFGSDVRERL